MEIGSAKEIYRDACTEKILENRRLFKSTIFFEKMNSIRGHCFPFISKSCEFDFFSPGQAEQNDPSVQPRKTFNLSFLKEAEAMEKLGQVFLRSKNPRLPVTVFLLPHVTPFIALPIYKRRQYRVQQLLSRCNLTDDTKYCVYLARVSARMYTCIRRDSHANKSCAITLLCWLAGCELCFGNTCTYHCTVVWRDLELLHKTMNGDLINSRNDQFI